MLNLITYNLNGIRSAMNKGLIDWLQTENPDIFCVQETKAQEDQVDLHLFKNLGYEVYWHSAEKKGYSGVATFTKRSPNRVERGCGISKYDSEGRILRTDFDDWTLLNCYFPSGTTGDIRQDFKMEFLVDFQQWIAELRKERPNIIVVGDYNIAHTEKDIHNPAGNKDSSGFLPEERAWMSGWFGSGFTDSFRHLYADRIEYSWWSFRANARANNKGWRIDYISVTDSLAPLLLDAGHLMDVVHSDHCPVRVRMRL